jgi:hypothetical protein
MMRLASIVVLVVSSLILTLSCHPEQTARDVSAALKGELITAQQQNQEKCNADPSVSPCQLINKAISAQNALITADQAYCGWSEATPLDQRDTPCVPVKTAEAGLKTAIANAQPFIEQLKGAIH